MFECLIKTIAEHLTAANIENFIQLTENLLHIGLTLQEPVANASAQVVAPVVSTSGSPSMPAQNVSKSS